jgi:hypothetical protein
MTKCLYTDMNLATNASKWMMAFDPLVKECS